MRDARELLSELRAEIDALAAELGTLTPPRHPDEFVKTSGLRGPMWNAVDSRDPRFVYPWRVRAIDDEPGRFVYVHHPRTFDPSDFETLTVDEARRLALALLAAAAYVDGGDELERRRVRELDHLKPA